MSKNKQIVETWDEVESEFPEKSTEFLFQMTCDRYKAKYGKEIDHGDVSIALADHHHD